MNFHEALELTKQGKNVHRTKWAKENPEKYYNKDSFEKGLFSFDDIEAQDWHEYTIEITHPGNNVIHTVGDLIKFLETFEEDSILSCEYINVQFGKYLGIKERPLLKSLFRKDGNIVKLNAMLY